MSDEIFHSLSEYLPRPSICGYCKQPITGGIGEYKGIKYHPLTNEFGKPCEPKDSCLGQTIEKHLRSISEPGT